MSAATGSAGAAGEVARGSLFTLGASAIAAAGQAGATLLLARWLSAESFGALALLTLVAQVAGTAAQLGLGSALVQARGLERDDARAVLGLAWLQGLVLSAAVALAAPAVSAVTDVAEIERLLPVYGLTLLLTPPAGVALALLQRRLAFGRVASLQLAGLGVGITASLGFAAAGSGTWALVAGRLATDTTVLVGALLSIGGAASPRLDLAHARGFVRFGASVAATQLVNALAGQLDTAILAVSLGAAALGHYSLASWLIMLPAVRIAGVVKGVAFAALARAQRTPSEFEDAAASLLLHVGAVCTPPVVGLALVARDLVPLALGPGWDDTAELVVRLMPAGVVFAWGSAMGAILLARGAAGVELRFALLRVAVLGPLLAVAARSLGAPGAALALSCYAVACLPLFFLVLSRWGGLAPRVIAGALAPGLAAALGLAAPVLLIQRALADAPASIRLVVCIAIGTLCAAACLRLAFPGPASVLVGTLRRSLVRRASGPPAAPAAAWEAGR